MLDNGHVVCGLGNRGLHVAPGGVSLALENTALYEDAATLGDFYAAGASAFGGGGALFNFSTNDAGSWELVEAGARDLVQAYEAVKGDA